MFITDYRGNIYLFANLCLNILYKKLPSYAYFESDSELDILYWNKFTNKESMIILNNILNRYKNDRYIYNIVKRDKFVSYKNKLLKLVLLINKFDI
uniref:Uncharacterized protein n=1 Tax=viral metagenome TaxID=1070528 RepID=A0A6C0JEM6_9ZZZZ